MAAGASDKSDHDLANSMSYTCMPDHTGRVEDVVKEFSSPSRWKWPIDIITPGV
jgi:hypothetical protein